MFYGLGADEVLISASGWLLVATGAYVVLRFAIKHGIRDALNERERRTGTPDSTPDAPGWTVEWPDK